MQTIQLTAAAHQDFCVPDKVDLHMAAPLEDSEVNLDEALANVLSAVRQSKNPAAMDGLGQLLAYMENLERKQQKHTEKEEWLTLTAPLTMSL